MECQCGVNAKGNAYCPLFPGDSLYQNYLQALKAYFTPSNLKNCHILNVGSQTCTTQPDLYTNLIKAKKEVDFFVAKVENSECINETINWSYYN